MQLYQFFIITFYANRIKCTQRKENIFLCFESFENDEVRKSYLNYYLQTELRFLLIECLSESTDSFTNPQHNIGDYEKELLQLCKTKYHVSLTHIQNKTGYEFTQINDIVCDNNGIFHKSDQKFAKLLEHLKNIAKKVRGFSIYTCYDKLYQNHINVFIEFVGYVSDAIIQQIENINNGMLEKIINALYYANYMIPEEKCLHTINEDNCDNCTRLNEIEWINVKFFFIKFQDYLNEERVQTKIQDIIDYIETNQIINFSFYVFNNFQEHDNYFLYNLVQEHKKLTNENLGTSNNNLININQVSFENINLISELVNNNPLFPVIGGENFGDWINNVKNTLENKLKSTSEIFFGKWNNFMTKSRGKYNFNIYSIDGGNCYIIGLALNRPKVIDILNYSLMQTTLRDFSSVLRNHFKELDEKLSDTKNKKN